VTPESAEFNSVTTEFVDVTTTSADFNLGATISFDFMSVTVEIVSVTLGSACFNLVDSKSIAFKSFTNSVDLEESVTTMFVDAKSVDVKLVTTLLVTVADACRAISQP